jgi:small subunit ribosomal protein S6
MIGGLRGRRWCPLPAARSYGGPPASAGVQRRITMAIDYEVTYILKPSLEEADIDARVATLAGVLTNNGGEVVGEIEKMGKRRLAYEIDDTREGYYVVMKFKSDAAQAKELERQMRLSEDVMRALLIRLDD